MIHLGLAYIVTRKKYGTRKRNAKVQQPCISLRCTKYFLLAEACFNVYRFVAARLLIFRPLFLFASAWSLNEINH